MSDMYGGVEKKTVVWGFVFALLLAAIVVLIIYLVAPEKLGLKKKSKMSNPFNPNSPATLQQLNGTSGQRWIQASNLGSDAMSNHYDHNSDGVDHLVGTFDRPVSWVGGTSNGLPSGWDTAKSASAVGSVVRPAPAAAGVAAPTGVSMPTKTSMSNNQASKIDVEKQLTAALNTV